MKITTLGTSHGVSEANRYCTSTMIETGGARYIVDVGAPVDYLFAKNGWKMTDIRGIFLTHMHIDHVSTLPFLVANLGCDLTNYVKRREGIEEIPLVTVMFPETQGRDGFLRWMKANHASVDMADPTHPFKSKTMTLSSLEDRKTYTDEHINVHAIRTAHVTSGSYAYVFEAEDKRVLITGDLFPDFHDFPEIALREHFDLVFCEFTHFKPETALPILQKCKTNRLVFQHISDLHGERAAWLEANRNAFPYEVSLAFDSAEYMC